MLATAMAALAFAWPYGPAYAQTTGRVSGVTPAPTTPPAAPSPADTPAPVRRADENVVRQADDAFGTSIGRESIGLYSNTSVRGFSPTVAGNARIDGMYFDPVWTPSTRIRRSVAIRVGLSAQGFAFPAPTGIVDFALRRPGDAAITSLSAVVDTYENASLEVDTTFPVTRTMAISAGIGLTRTSSYSGTDSEQLVTGLTALWRPTPQTEIQPFFSRSEIRGDEFAPIYLPDGAYLPPEIPRRRFLGPARPTYRSTAVLQGAQLRHDFNDDWQARMLLVRTYFDTELSASNLMIGVRPDRTVRQHLFIVDPPKLLKSDSGEARLIRRIVDGERLHQLHFNLRVRDRWNRYGGSAVINLGATTIDSPVAPLPGPYAFRPQSLDRVRQVTGGIAYEGRWRGVGELSIGVQRTHYRKTVNLPGRAPSQTRAAPWLYSIAAAAHLRDDLAVYAGYTRGLEESGTAPSNAANREEPLPAILTSQRDAGLRWTLTPKLRLVAGVFDVHKPYFQLDAANMFTRLGEQRHRGVELSLSGELMPGLNVVAGAVLMKPRVSGQGVALGRVGEIPVNQPERNLKLNLDWRPPDQGKLSFDLGVSHLSDRAATSDDRVWLPARTLVDVGGRYRFNLRGHPATLRVAVTNVTDEHGYELRSSGAYDIFAGRVAALSLNVDF